MKLIVGLGNPGKKYEKTRHNLGFMTLDRFRGDVASHASWSASTKLKSQIAFFDTAAGERIIVAKPGTFMNDSGLAVRLIADFYDVSPKDIWIVHDELDLPLGALRIRFGGAAAGHHGVESVIEHLGTDKFWRYRLGVGMSHTGKGDDGKEHTLSKLLRNNVDEYVLGSFTSSEHGKMKDLLKRANQALTFALSHDLPATMNKYNTR